MFLKKYPKKPGEFRVVYAGNLGKMQNVELILETAALMKDDADISFYIVGGGVNEVQLKTFAKEKDLNNVTFVGMQPPEEVADLYAAADVNVIPLQKGLIYAALPSKTADCLIAGKPIITCVDDESAFAKLVRKYGIENANNDSPANVRCVIDSIMNGMYAGKTKDLKTIWQRNLNVSEYCNQIETM